LNTKHIVAVGALAEVQITITVGLEDVSGAKQSRSISLTISSRGKSQQ
jgi:hypothetical protein